MFQVEPLFFFRIAMHIDKSEVKKEGGKEGSEKGGKKSKQTSMFY